MAYNPAGIGVARELAQWTGGVWRGGEPERLCRVAIDSRALPPDALFIALEGVDRDGHDYIHAAFRAGARAAMARRDAADRLCAYGPLLLVEDTRRGLRDLARGYADSTSAFRVGITGSVGKTTVKEWTADMLGAIGGTHRSRGNWNNELGVPLSLLDMPRDAQWGVFELGMNHPGEIRPLAELLRPRAAIVTRIAPVHIEAFSGLEAVADEKADLLRALPPEGTAVIGRDQALFERLREAAPCRVVSVSLEGEADYEGRARADGRLDVWERSTGERCVLEMPLPGRHVMENALLALALARGQGVAWASVAEALRAFRPLPGRWVTGAYGGVRTIDDTYNANPESMRAAVAAAREMPCEGRRWFAFGAMLELGGLAPEAHYATGRLMRPDDGGLVAVGLHADRMREGALDAGLSRDRVAVAADATDAGRWLAGRVRPGDLVLFKGSRGMRMEDALAAMKAKRLEE